MVTVKSYTDLEQSRKLAEILPLESADMYIDCTNPYYIHTELKHIEHFDSEHYPCWSLAALLEQLDYPQLSKDKLGSGKEGWMVSVYPNDCRYDSCWYENPIDACVAMVKKLNELNLL